MERTLLSCVCSKMVRQNLLSVPKTNYSLCCTPRQPHGACGCPPVVPGQGRRIMPLECGVRPIPYNPCRPIFAESTDSHLKYKYIFFFVCIPLIICQMFRAFGDHHSDEDALTCREYEYMRRRTKRFPWGEGTKTFFHNDHANPLPSMCGPPPPDMCE